MRACVRAHMLLKRWLLLDGYMICACIHNLLKMFDMKCGQTIFRMCVAWFLVLCARTCVCVCAFFLVVLFCFASFNFVRHHLIPTWMISALEQNQSFCHSCTCDRVYGIYIHSNNHPFQRMRVPQWKHKKGKGEIMANWWTPPCTQWIKGPFDCVMENEE